MGKKGIGEEFTWIWGIVFFRKRFDSVEGWKGKIGNMEIAIDIEQGGKLQNSISANKQLEGGLNTQITRTKANLAKSAVKDFIIGRSGNPIGDVSQRDMISAEFAKLEQTNKKIRK